jgi:hypothetical protein
MEQRAMEMLKSAFGDFSLGQLDQSKTTVEPCHAAVNL